MPVMISSSWIKCHILSAALKMMKMNSLDNVPSEMSVVDPENVWMISMEEQKELLHTTATNIAEQFVNINFHNHEDPDHTEKCNIHARCLLTLACF